MPEELEIKGIKLRYASERRPQTLATSYLMEAIEAIELSANARGLYSEAMRTASVEERRGWLNMAAQAAERRVRHSRHAILLAAFAAESFANEFIAMSFSGQTAKTLDRLSTVEKLALAPRLALGFDLFERDAQPLQDVRELFRLRDVLVHPKPGRGLPALDSAQADPAFNPAVAARHLVAVALVAEALLRHAPVGDRWDLMVTCIAGGQHDIAEYGRKATETLAGPDEPFSHMLLTIDSARLPDFSERDDA